MRKLIALLTLAVALTAAPAANATITSVFGGDVTCTVQGNNTRFCGSDSPRSTTKTWDGMPIDVNVAFPPDAGGADNNFPMIMIFHGYGGGKLGLGSMQRWLDQGYAVFSMTDRGFHESCGSAPSKAADVAGCADGYVRLMDDRYEVRDAQYFAGKLVDEGLVDAQKIGATGGSYGGGMSMALAALKDRTMLPDGSLVPWTSPLGTPMHIAAAAPEVPWTDLAYSLTPNGSTLDYVGDAPYQGRPGVMKNFVPGLYLAGLAAPGYYVTPGGNPDADLTTWLTTLSAGEPYGNDVQTILSEITSHHSSYYIDHSEAPAPLLISNGFTDDLFPADESIRFYNRTKDQYPNDPISLFFYDFGHMRGQGAGKLADATLLGARENAWFAHYVKGTGPDPQHGVETLTQTCPFSDPSQGPFIADSWATLPKGEIRLSSPASKTIQAAAGDPAVGAAFDPVSVGNACATASAADQAGVATYRLPAAPAGGYTLMGSPTVIADFKLTDANSQVAARLLDVDPGGTETLVGRGLWRPKTSPNFVHQVFQLHPNGWTFKQGHIAKLELLPNDSPYGRTSNNQQDVLVKNLELRLPVMQKPGYSKGLVKTAAPKVVPTGYTLADEFKDLAHLSASLVSKSLPVKNGKLRARVGCPAAFASCNKGRVTVKTGKGAIGKGTFTLAGGKAKTLKISLNARGRKLFKARGRKQKGHKKTVPVTVGVSSLEASAKARRATAIGRLK